jgi:hypothetical protein
LIHASRTDRLGVEAADTAEGKKLPQAVKAVKALVPVSGGRVSNTWVICPKVGNNCSKEQLIPHVLLLR